MTNNENPYVELFQKVLFSLENFEIPYVLVGGAVVPYYGNIRSTQDIDLMLYLENTSKNEFNKWLNQLKNENLSLDPSEIKYAMEKNIHGTIFEKTSYTFRVDLKNIYTELDKLTFKYRKRAEIMDVDVWISSPESLIGVKSSPGFRSKTDEEDIISIIETINLDLSILFEYLKITGSKSYLCSLLKDQNSTECQQLYQNMDCG